MMREKIRVMQINTELRDRGYADKGYYDGLYAERALLLKLDSTLPIIFHFGVW